MVDLPERLRGRTPAYQSEPHHSWHGRECVQLAPGVIRFMDEKSPVYHLISAKYLRA